MNQGGKRCPSEEIWSLIHHDLRELCLMTSSRHVACVVCLLENCPTAVDEV